jgi:hypothetical protein
MRSSGFRSSGFRSSGFRWSGLVRLVVLGFAVVIWMLPTASAFDLAGKWEFVFETDQGIRRAPVTLELNGEQVAGKFGETDVKGTFSGGKLELKFPFYSTEAGFEADLSLHGAAEGEALKGEWTFSDNEGTWTGNRTP